MKPKFTPGPWRFFPTHIINDGKNDGIVAYTDQVGVERENSSYGISGVCSIHPRPEEAEANAHLIAAAPQMYEALSELVRCFEFNKGTLELDQIAIDHIQDVLKKARGEE